MTVQERAVRRKRAAEEPFIIARSPEGFRVHSPKYPSFVYQVAGIPDQPECSCTDFEYHAKDPDWCCKHILAVLDKVEEPREAEPAAPEDHDAEEREAIRSDGEPAPPATTRKRTPRSPNGSSLMLIKRSVSPDGRIDSLSVEFSCPVDKLPEGEIREKAEKMLDLQYGIVGSFRDRNTTARETDEEQSTRRSRTENGPVPAKLLDIGGMNGKYGRRLFINVQVNGETIKLFGSRKQLAEAATRAGVEVLDREIEEGARLDIPCRVTTSPSPDGRYTNVDRVFPPTAPNGPRSIGQARR